LPPLWRRQQVLAPRRRSPLPRALRFCCLLALALTSATHAFDLQGHRGARGLAPENTLIGFGVAMAIGVTTLETDLALTSDGILVLSHEPLLSSALTRRADGSWLPSDGPPIITLSYADTQAYDVGRLNAEHRYAVQWPHQRPYDGERIPTLNGLFELARERRSPGGAPLRFNIETKLTPSGPVPTADAESFAAAVVAAVRKAGMTDRVMVQSFDWRSLAKVKERAPEMVTACLTIDAASMNTVQPASDGASPWHAGLRASDHGNSLPRLVRAAGCSVWSPYWGNLTAESLAEAHALRLKVIPWTINDPAELVRLAALGIDGAITDYPDRARAVLEAQGIVID
jgi:glycerophosphoryl diester phosphodiesterase